MPDDLYAKFLPQFIPVARARVATSLAAARQRDHSGLMTVVRELHTLAGEAGLLGLVELVPLARDCEQKARARDGADGEPDVEDLIAALRELERAVEGISARAADEHTP